MKKRYQEGGEVDAMEEANNRSEFAPRKVSIGAEDDAAIDDKLRRRAMERSRVMQQEISAGSDFTDRPQDEGYRPFVSVQDRAKAEGARDSGGDARVAESTGQFGDAGTSRVVKPSKSGVVTKEQLAKSGYDNLRDYMNAQQGLTRRKDTTAKAEPKAETKPAAKTGSIMDKSPAERAAMVKLGLQRQEAERAMKDFKAKKTAGYAKGGVTASSRGDGIAQRGKTRGKMC